MFADGVRLCLLLTLVTIVNGTSVGECYDHGVARLDIVLPSFQACLTIGFPDPTCSMAPLTMVQAVYLLLVETFLIALASLRVH